MSNKEERMNRNKSIIEDYKSQQPRLNRLAGYRRGLRGNP